MTHVERSQVRREVRTARNQALVVTLAVNVETTGMDRRERNDCTVSALAHAAGIPYEVAYAIGLESGRRVGGRADIGRVIATAKRHGVTLHKVRMGSKTLRKFLRLRPTGRYIANKRGHAFSVIDGVVGDRTPLGSIVRDAWQVVDA